MALLEQHEFLWRPASYTVSAQTTLFTVRDAYFQIISCVTRIATGFNGPPTIKVGTVATVDLLAAAADITEATPGVYLGSGTNKLIAPGTAIIVDYTAHASTTAGIAKVVITGFRVGA